MDFSLPKAEIEQLVGSVDDEQSRCLQLYGEAIIEVSRRTNLVSRGSLSGLAEHMIDSSALVAFAELRRISVEGLELADLGSGAGFPGVVVAVLCPDVRVVLVESRRSKVVFLKEVVRRLDVANVEVVHQRLEDLAGTREFDIAAARALGDVKKVLPACLQLVAPGGRLVLFKGPAWAEEEAAARTLGAAQNAEIARTEAIALPGLERETVFVEFHVKRPGSIGSGVMS